MGEVVAATHVRLFRLAARLLGSRADAEDAVQETYLRAFEALRQGRYEEQSKLEPWLATIMTRYALDVARRRKVRAIDPAIDPNSLAWEGLSDDAHLALVAIARWLSGLPVDQRAAIVLKYWEGMSNAEVGRALGVSEGAVEQRLLRARGTLKKVMDDER